MPALQRSLARGFGEGGMMGRSPSPLPKWADQNAETVRADNDRLRGLQAKLVNAMADLCDKSEEVCRRASGTLPKVRHAALDAIKTCRTLYKGIR